jgi:ABC-type multidrug transport system fused ATPase/permease subunit
VSTSTEPGVFRKGLQVLALAIRTEPRSFALGTAGTVLYALATVGGSVVLGRVTDRVVLPAFEAGEVGRASLALGAAAILVVAVVRALGILGRRYGAYLMQYRLQAVFRRRVTRQYLALPIEWHRRHTTGELLSVANADVESAFFTIAPLPMAIGVGVMLLVTAILLLLSDLFLAAVGFTVGPLLAYLNWNYQRRMAVVATAAQELRSDVSNVAHESIDAGLVVKVLGRETDETERFRGHSDDLRDRMVELGRLRARFDPLVEALPNIAILLVLLVGVWRVQNSDLTPGDLIQFAYLFGLLALPMRVFGWLLGEFPRSVAGWERVERVLDASAYQTYGEEAGGGGGGAAIELGAVRYHHPVSRGDAPLPADEDEHTRGVEDITFAVAPGRTIAVVGPTGSGKSTVAQLLVRLVDPDRGELRYDGAALDTLARPALARDIAVVFQDSFLFDDTVRNNITLGEQVDDARVVEAAQLAQAHGFISRLPQGYDTPVGERGATLSGGQRQRVALARALVRGPRLLILDDATSSVDPAVEAAILKGLRESELPATVIVIAYRRATVALADEVVFVRGGRAVARGSHERLMEDEPQYAALLTAYDHREGDAV